MLATIRSFRTECAWLLALAFGLAWYSTAAPEARDSLRIYHTGTNWCYEYPLDCLWDDDPPV